MTDIPNHEFPVKRIELLDKPKYKQGSPEERHMRQMAYADRIAKEVNTLARMHEKQRRGWQ